MGTSARGAAHRIAVFAIGFSILAISTSADAQEEFAELLQYITTQNVALGQAEQEDAALEDLIANETKAQKEIAASAQSIDEQIKAKLAEFKPEIDRRNAAADAIAENWNSECQRERVGKLPREIFERCERLKPEVDKTVVAIREQVKKDTLAYIGPKLLDIKRRQDKAKADAAERIKKNAEARDAAHARALKIREYLEEARSRLRQLCLEAADRKGPYWRERLSHCESVGWDGARRDLAPLTEMLIKPPFSSSAN